CDLEQISSAAPFRRGAFVMLFMLAAGCAPYTATKFADYFGMSKSNIEGEGFTHVVFSRDRQRIDDELHIYIDDDGNADAGSSPGTDPTPELSMALNLAVKDTNDRAVIGRPCYFGVSVQEQCDAKYWTSHRYSEGVVRSMAAAIRQVRQPRHQEIYLIGIGGGGVIATLLEPLLEDVVAVVTVGSNLDTDAWASHNGMPPLSGSLNPAREVGSSNVPHFLLLGNKHETVPQWLGIAYAEGREHVIVQTYPGYDDECCWEKDWESILNDVNAEIADRSIPDFD
ncbi:MAG: hypothetical protein KJO31_06845, partial [Gammaproteobacteria bacterium]|nr:hypothetical protein [Gammaproteobacteria bacterium]